MSNYEKGKYSPDVIVLKRLSEYYGVTTDYLIGRSPHMTTDMNIEKMCCFTGLYQSSLRNLHECKKLGVAEVLNVLLSREMICEFINFCNDVISAGAFTEIMKRCKMHFDEYAEKEKSEANENKMKLLLDSFCEADNKRNQYENQAKQLAQILLDYYYNGDSTQQKKGYIIEKKLYPQFDNNQNNKIGLDDILSFDVCGINLYDFGVLDVNDSEEKQ